jgi:hypothetical protein
MHWLGYAAIFCLILFSAVPAYSLICIGATQNNDWGSVQMTKGNPGFFTTMVYNKSAAGESCDPGDYTVELALKDSQFAFEEIFDGNAQPASFQLGDGEDRKVLVTLTPKVDSGTFTVLITGKRLSPGTGGVGIVKTVTARITIIIGNGVSPAYADMPFWRIRKDCPGGFVVSQGEECPRVCENGQKADEQGKCPEDEQKPNTIVVEREKLVPVGSTAFFVLGGLQLSFESFILIIAIVIAVCVIAFFLLYTRNLKRQFRGGLR